MKPNTKDMSISEQLCCSTIRIESTMANGQSCSGTGFFYNVPASEPNTYYPCVVTNKHVIDNSVIGRFVLTCFDSFNNEVHHRYQIVNFEQAWIKHPDPEIDVAVFPIQPHLKNIKQKLGAEPFYIPITSNLIPTDNQLNEMCAMEEIVMVGYPNGIWDTINNKPIIRKGTTATSPVLNFNGKKEFMIDAACIPGSSGSPVFVLNQGIVIDKHNNINMGQSRLYFMGILYAGPQLNVSGTISFANIPHINSQIPINLGLVIKSSVMKDFEKILNDRYQ